MLEDMDQHAAMSKYETKERTESKYDTRVKVRMNKAWIKTNYSKRNPNGKEKVEI